MCGAAALVTLVPFGAEAKVRPSAARSIALLNPHTGEAVRATYWEKGRYVAEELRVINRLLRDHHTDRVHEIDPALLDLLHGVQSKLDTRAAFHVMSGYRSPETNEALRRRGRAAKHSLHMEGKAIDVRMPGRRIKHLHRAAVSLKAGGVGYYPRSGFIHLDVGPVRRW